jgi:hypothetical protein
VSSSVNCRIRQMVPAAANRSGNPIDQDLVIKS